MAERRRAATALVAPDEAAAVNYGRELLRSLPDPQVTTLAQLAGGHVDATWHLAECGCCVCLHVDGKSTAGYLIGKDGRYEWIDHHGANS